MSRARNCAKGQRTLKTKKPTIRGLQKQIKELEAVRDRFKEEIRGILNENKALANRWFEQKEFMEKNKTDLEATIRSIKAENNGLLSNNSAASARERKLRDDMENLEAQKRAFEDLLLKALSRVR